MNIPELMFETPQDTELLFFAQLEEKATNTAVINSSDPEARPVKMNPAVLGAKPPIKATCRIRAFTA